LCYFVELRRVDLVRRAACESSAMRAGSLSQSLPDQVAYQLASARRSNCQSHTMARAAAPSSGSGRVCRLREHISDISAVLAFDFVGPLVGVGFRDAGRLSID